jgi:exonuclease III
MEKLIHFFNKLEMVIQKLMGKCKTLILCGDWNINLLQPSSHTRELNDLLLQYNLRHIVNAPTRITKTTATLLDVMTTNERKSVNSLKVIDLGLSDHYSQILSFPLSDPSNTYYTELKKDSLVKQMFRNFSVY